MTPAATLGIVFACYVGTTAVLWCKGTMGSMRANLHEFAGVVAAFIALFLNACAIEDNHERLDQYLQKASIEAFYDEDWNIYLRLVGDPGYVISDPIKITPTFYRRGRRPFPIYTGHAVELYEGDYDEPEPQKSIIIPNAAAILCQRQAQEECQGMTLFLVEAQLGDLAPVSVDKRIPNHAE